GETLADRIARGAIPMDEALPLFLQIAEGLAAAHETGVIHRDLKPANIKITEDGEIKILDFGLAKDVSAAKTISGDPEASLSPTLTFAATQQGVILGTAAYMSPEQAKGKTVDRRTDIWAFGACLMEALSGKRAFKGTDASELMASILMMEPEWDVLPEEIPSSLRRLLRRCLQRKVTERLQHIGDVRLELKEILAYPAEVAPTGAAMSQRVAWHRVMAWGLGGAVVGAALTGLALMLLGGFGIWPSPMPVSRLSLMLPEEARAVSIGWPESVLAISPDGSRVAFSGASPRLLYVRSLDDLGLRAIAGTEGARNPFFSPDGRYVAFFTGDGDLKKVETRGNVPPLTLVRGIPNGQWAFGSWGDNDMIVFSTWSGGLSVIPADGGTPTPLTAPKDEADQDPQVLPGSEAVLFFSQKPEISTIKALKLEGSESVPTTLLDNASHPRYLASGHLLFVRDGGLLAVRFDPVGLKITGSPRAVPIDVTFDDFRVSDPTPQLAVSRTGTLVYALAQGTYTQQSDLVWVDRDGNVEAIDSVPFGLPHLQLSPDNTQLALEYREGPDVKISIYNMVDGGIDTLLTTKKQEYPGMPVWMPDGKNIVFSHPGTQEGEVVMKRVGGNTQEMHLFRTRGDYLMPRSISADGKLLAYNVFPPGSSFDIGVFHFDEGADGEDRSFATTPQSEYNPALSPDGRWIAYVRNEGVFLSRYPSGEGMRRVSVDGGNEPLWSRDGKEIFYLRRLEMAEHGRIEIWVRTVATASGLDLGEPKKLFDGWYLGSDDAGHSYDISLDGERFLMVRLDENFEHISELVVVQNWFEDLRHLVPAD
ncbi:MAG: protein kinase, partial [Actinobacteria bacterium]|nr:protein kinase [Actinomycetota bacterium]